MLTSVTARDRQAEQSKFMSDFKGMLASVEAGRDLQADYPDKP